MAIYAVSIYRHLKDYTECYSLFMNTLISNVLNYFQTKASDFVS